METIKQKHYPQLEIDCKEQDIIQVWMNGKEDSNVIQIEKDNLQAVIDLLKREADSFKNLNKAPVIGSYCPKGCKGLCYTHDDRITRSCCECGHAWAI